MEDLTPDAWVELADDIVLWKQSITIRKGQHDLWQIGLKGQLLRKEKWHFREKVEEKIPHLIK
jgi:hypothetical protein